MRLWSLHPKYLDRQGLLASWREGLLARAVLRGETRGYTRHPQLERFRAHRHPRLAINAYLAEVHDEATRRGYAFDRSRIGPVRPVGPVPVTSGQLAFEWLHLQRKLAIRSPAVLAQWEGLANPECHPLFLPRPGPVESWERASTAHLPPVELEDRWNATWDALGVARTPALHACLADLVGRYSEPHRKYHTLQHLDECHSSFELLRSLADRPAEIEVALWFHDAIYDPRSDDNEARSAALARATVLGAGGAPDAADRIAALVIATRHAAAPEDPDGRVLVDVDLSILGAPAARFDEYERQVREEYAWVPDAVYGQERGRILRGFLARPAIFSTPPFLRRLERQARGNIERSLAALGGSQ